MAFFENMTQYNPWRFCVAPMLDWTDRHCRYFHRQLSRHARLYTEMVTTGAIIYGDKARHLNFNKEEHPVALQLGGSDPKDLAVCARLLRIGAMTKSISIAVAPVNVYSAVRLEPV